MKKENKYCLTALAITILLIMTINKSVNSLIQGYRFIQGQKTMFEYKINGSLSNDGIIRGKYENYTLGK